MIFVEMVCYFHNVGWLDQGAQLLLARDSRMLKNSWNCSDEFAFATTSRLTQTWGDRLTTRHLELCHGMKCDGWFVFSIFELYTRLSYARVVCCFTIQMDDQ